MGKPKSKAASRRAKKLAKKRGLLEKGQTGEEDLAAVGQQEQDAVVAGKYSANDLLDKAEEFSDRYEYDMARRFCQRALEIDSDDPRALEMTASFLLEDDNVEEAKHCLGRAVTLRPDEGHTKFLTLAQLFSGRESLQLYDAGISIVRKAVAELSAGDDKSKELSREMSNALCSRAELFMTDLCDEDEAEEECKSSIAGAEEADPANPEAKQTRARYLLVREQFDEAKKAMRESLSLWLPQHQALLDNRLEASASCDPVEACQLLYATRISTSKILIELEMWDEATQVLEGLLEEDDEAVETWYLLGWVNRLRATSEDGDDGYNGNARFYLSRAKKAHAKKPTDDQDMVQHIDEILDELGPEQQEDAGEEDADGDDWEDVQSSDDDDGDEEKMEQS